MLIGKRLYPRIFPRISNRLDVVEFLFLLDSTVIEFWAAWADAAGVNQTLLIGTGPVTTTHAETFYGLGSDGEYDAYTANQPVWQYDADGDYLVAQDTGTNDQIQSNDQTNAEWTATNVTVAQDESGFATGKDACTLTATAANGTVIANAITAASGEHATKWYIKRKTGTGNIDLTLDNGTGWTTVTLTSDFDLFAIDQAALTNPQIGIRIVTSGDAVIVGNAECHLTSTVEKVESLGPIFTTTGQASTSELRNVYPSANHSNTEGPYYLEFENTGDDVVLLEAGTDEVLKIEDGGTDIATNGQFDTDTDWTKGAGWTISGGQAHADGSNPGLLYQEQNPVSGVEYTIDIFLATYTGGSIGAVYLGGVSAGTVSGPGFKRLTVTTVNNTGDLILSASADFEASIEYIRVYRVDGKYLKLTDRTTQLQMKLT